MHKDTVHEGKRDWICSSCGRCFADKTGLKGHVERVHEGKKVPKDTRLCPQCGRSVLKSSLQSHIDTIHKGIRNFKCETCGKGYTGQYDLQQHIQIVHEGQRNYKCDSCGKGFARPSALKQHVKTIHEGIKNFKCETCGKLFAQVGQLTTHKSHVHEGKPYKPRNRAPKDSKIGIIDSIKDEEKNPP